MPLALLPHQVVFAAIDFESAGVSPGSTDTPVQIGIAVMRDLALAPGESFVSYLHTTQPITWQASQVHGITAAHLASAPPFLSLWPELNSRLANRCVVAHGAATEKRFLRAFPLHGFGPWVDTLTLARRFWPGLRDYSLESLIAAANLSPELCAACPGRHFHDALFDSIASLLVLRHLVLQAGLAQRPLQQWLP